MQSANECDDHPLDVVVVEASLRVVLREGLHHRLAQDVAADEAALPGVLEVGRPGRVALVRVLPQVPAVARVDLPALGEIDLVRVVGRRVRVAKRLEGLCAGEVLGDVVRVAEPKEVPRLM